MEIPEDQFAMGFIYDATTEKLSGMNLVATSPNSITVGTRHFSSFVLSTIAKAGLKKDIDS